MLVVGEEVIMILVEHKVLVDLVEVDLVQLLQQVELMEQQTAVAVLVEVGTAPLRNLVLLVVLV
jgi:hypothetical protein